MNNISDFYDNLDLKYPEIGIAMQDIDRTNPGKVKFIIPILTPNMDTTKLVEQKAYQNSSNLMNADKTLEIENISITNYIEIPMPKELCAFVGGEFNVENVGNMTERHQGNITIGGNTGSSGGITHTHATLSGTGDLRFHGIQTEYKGVLKITPTDEYRYIKKGSKWIIVFVGGDITKPRVIARYLED